MKKYYVKFIRNVVNRQQIVRCYVKNLLQVLKAVYELLEELDRRHDIFSYNVIITVDHGELLGEYSMFSILPNYNLSQLTLIPWTEVYDLA